MPLLDIENTIKEDTDSRFRLVNIASQRARELNAPKENTAPEQSFEYTKVTTNALNEIIRRDVVFTHYEDKPETQVNEEANG